MGTDSVFLAKCLGSLNAVSNLALNWHPIQEVVIQYTPDLLVLCYGNWDKLWLQFNWDT